MGAGRSSSVPDWIRFAESLKEAVCMALSWRPGVAWTQRK
jgi:hypothetical protein